MIVDWQHRRTTQATLTTPPPIRLESTGVSEDDRLDIEFFDSLPTDMDQVVDELREQGRFTHISLRSIPSPPLLALSIVARGFFKEAGKEGCQQFRRLLVRAIQAALPAKQERGGYVFGVRVNRPDSYVLFTFLRAAN